MTQEIKKNDCPYVISCDVNGLMADWSRRKGLTVPNADFFKGITRELTSELGRSLGTEVITVSENDLRSGIKSKICAVKAPVISMDRAYVSEDETNVLGFLDTTRAVDKNLQSIGLVARNGQGSIDFQIDTLTTTARRRGASQIVLVDDVVFSGEGMIDIVRRFRNRGMEVNKVIVGVGIQEGIDLLNNNGVQTDCVETFEEVVDEICERDFYAGVPLSGRCLIDGDKQYGAPYFLPFGDPQKWASIPETAESGFSEFCLYQSKLLWRNVENESRRVVTLRDLPRRLYLPETDESLSTPEVLDSIELVRRDSRN